jgi:hypothetical protein
MSERLSPDRRSFKQFLPALLQQIGRRGLRGSADGRIDPQWLPELIQIRQQVKSGRLDLDAVLNRLVKLSQRIVGAGGAGVWLFTNDEIFYSAGAGNASNDERLRLDVISKLATSHHLRKETLLRLDKPTPIDTDHDTDDGPGRAMSLLVEPICQGHNVAGALAVFSDELNAFTELDAANIHVLAAVLAQALSKAAEAGLQESVALEPAAMMQLIGRIIPGLQRMLENDGNARQSKRRFLPSEAEQELRAAGVGTELLQESPELRAIEVTDGTRTAHDQESRAPISYSATSLALEETNVPGIGVPAALESEAVKTPALGAVLREKYERKVAFVKNYISRALSVLRLAGCWLFNRVETTGHQVWHAARYRNNPLQLLVKAATRSVQRMKASISNAAGARKRIRFAAADRSNLPAVESKRSLPGPPEVVGQRGLRHARHSFLHALENAKTRLQMLLQFRPSRRALWRTAPVLGILVIATIFIILRTRLHNPTQSAGSNSRKTTHENTIPLSEGASEVRETVRTDGVAKASIREAHVAEPSGTLASLQVSHLQVTDRTTKDALRALSPYELAGLRRRAEYGDDSAAFQMGMAYEVGRGLPQSCTNAARWVARAAGEGNAAAQYNLGLRYRDGDGVPVNEDEAGRWLRKAAAQQRSDVQLSLAEH